MTICLRLLLAVLRTTIAWGKKPLVKNKGKLPVSFPLLWCLLLPSNTLAVRGKQSLKPVRAVTCGQDLAIDVGPKGHKIKLHSEIRWNSQNTLVPDRCRDSICGSNKLQRIGMLIDIWYGYLGLECITKPYKILYFQRGSPLSVVQYFQISTWNILKSIFSVSNVSTELGVWKIRPRKEDHETEDHKT